MLFSLPTLSFHQGAQFFFTINLFILQTLGIFSVLGNCLDVQDVRRRVYVWCVEVFTRNLANDWTHHSISSHCSTNHFCKAHDSAWWTYSKQWCWLNEHIALRYWILDAKHLYKPNDWGKTSNREWGIFLWPLTYVNNKSYWAIPVPCLGCIPESDTSQKTVSGMTALHFPGQLLYSSGILLLFLEGLIGSVTWF